MAWDRRWNSAQVPRVAECPIAKCIFNSAYNIWTVFRKHAHWLRYFTDALRNCICVSVENFRLLSVLVGFCWNMFEIYCWILHGLQESPWRLSCSPCSPLKKNRGNISVDYSLLQWRQLIVTFRRLTEQFKLFITTWRWGCKIYGKISQFVRIKGSGKLRTLMPPVMVNNNAQKALDHTPFFI